MVWCTRRLSVFSQQLMARESWLYWRSAEVAHSLWAIFITFFLYLLSLERFNQTSFLLENNILCYQAMLLKPFCLCTGQNKPAASYEKITINKNSRATLNSVRHIISKNKYRKDLRMVSLKTPPPKKTLRGNCCFKQTHVCVYKCGCVCVFVPGCPASCQCYSEEPEARCGQEEAHKGRQDRINTWLINKLFMFGEKTQLSVSSVITFYNASCGFFGTSGNCRWLNVKE